MFARDSHAPLDAHLPEWGVVILESHHAADFRMAPTRAPYGKVVYVLAGEGRAQIDTTQHPISADSLCVVPANTEHRFLDEPSSPMALLVLCIGPEALRGPGGRSLAYDRFQLFQNKPLLRECRELLRRIMIEQTLQNPHHDLLMLALTWELLASLKRFRPIRIPEGAIRPDPMSPARARLEVFLKQPTSAFLVPRSIDEAAESLGLSRRHFTNLLRKITGSSWVEHCRGARIRHAKLLLRETRRAVVSIAFECGFEDLSTFYRSFKKSAGISPERWRRDGSAP
jgi:AraC family L-rhamnose operon regulatory protein RhaS